jgi:hypothetical protein
LDFIVRILFTGLIAFVPNQDGTELTVLLLNADHNYHVSDGSSLPHHKPVLIARAGDCTGDCPKRDSDVAQFMFADKSLAVALDSLEAAVGGGAAWLLAGSDLSIRKSSSSAPDLPALSFVTDARGTVNGQPRIIPTTAAEREDYSWVADLKRLCATGSCLVNQDVLASQPPSNLVAARLRLRSGKVFTYSVARLGANVTPVRFERRDGQGSPSSYTQAVASWVAADIAVSGDSIEIVESKFNGGTGRSMILEPDANGKIEMAVLNLPPFVPPASSANNAPEVGKHFEMFYEMNQNAQAPETRLVPRAGAPAGAQSYSEVDWHLIHPQAESSALLNALRLDIGRTVYDRTICPPGNNTIP